MACVSVLVVRSRGACLSAEQLSSAAVDLCEEENKVEKSRLLRPTCRKDSKNKTFKLKKKILNYQLKLLGPVGNANLLANPFQNQHRRGR